MDFDDRLKQAIKRGEQHAESVIARSRGAELTEAEAKRIHGDLRLRLSDHIESCLDRLPGHFPGFRFETIVGEKGWGATCWRDDLVLTRGQRGSAYTRIELVIRPFHGELRVVDLSGKATVRNKEIYSRNYFMRVEEADEGAFTRLIDAWVLEFAELYSSSVKRS